MLHGPSFWLCHPKPPLVWVSAGDRRPEGSAGPWAHLWEGTTCWLAAKTQALGPWPGEHLWPSGPGRHGARTGSGQPRAIWTWAFQK